MRVKSIMRAFPRAATLLALFANAISDADAVPLPPFPSVDICGRVAERSWVPAEVRRGQPGFSGSLGRDRTFPAHLEIVLEDYSGIDASAARRTNLLLGYKDSSDIPKRVLLRLQTDNPRLLEDVLQICVEGFTVRGDEGGTWTSFRRIVTLPGRR